MECTPARPASFLAACETPCIFQSTPNSNGSSPESGFFEGQSINSSYNISTSLAFLSEDDSHYGSSVLLYSSDTTSQFLHLPKESPPRVDILGKLKSCRPVVCNILRYLDTRDLASACRVSSEWRRLCLSIPEEANRFQTYIREREEHWESSRENMREPKPPKREPSSAPPLTAHNAKAQVPNSQAGRNVETKSRLDLFTEEAKHLGAGEWLWPCPICQRPSRVTNKVATCRCGYRFCPKCRRDYHSPKPCETHVVQVPSRSQRNTIGSKYSKRQLRRL